MKENTALERAYLSLEGLSIGDAFGQGFFVAPEILESLIELRALPSEPWIFTDDTMMALSIFYILRKYGFIDQDKLAVNLAKHYDNTRGYGPAMHGLLHRIRMGESWQEAAPDLFAGQGSYGNGAAMRVAPLGAYFADDIKKVIQQAELSAVVTHSHPEAIAGAIATALAAAWAWQLANDKILLNRADFLDLILPSVPKSEVSRKIRKARDMDKTASVEFAVSVLGNGSLISAQDTVPFTLWCAGTHLNNYEEALWLTLSGQGDRDTTCAIVGGIVALYTGKEAIPNHWLNAREALPSWPFIETITLS